MCETQKMKLLDYFMRSAWPHATHLLREPSGLLAGLCPEECSSAGKAHALLNRGLFSALWSCRPHLQQSQHINSDSHGRVTREPEGKAGRKKSQEKGSLEKHHSAGGAWTSSSGLHHVSLFSLFISTSRAVLPAEM